MAIFSTGPVLTGSAAAVGTIPVATYNKLALSVDLSATTETISVTASVDGTNFDVAKLRPIDLATGAVTAASDVKDGLYLFDVTPFHTVKITKSAASETITVRSGLGR